MEPISQQLVTQVRRTIARYDMIQRGDAVLVAVSGGPDSSALAHVLASLREELDLSLHIGHLNHMFRGRAAELDAEAVSDLAVRLDIPCTIEAIDVPARIRKTGQSKQAGARQVRYEFLDRVAAGVGARVIALGHNADDQAETVLMNLLRGAGATGLAGIPPVREGRYVRPLIETLRTEIEAYCHSHDLSYRIDESNLKPVYLRNKIRLDLMPLILREYNPNLVRSLGRTAEVLRDETQYLEELAVAALSKARVAYPTAGNQNGLLLRLTILGELPRAILRRVLRLGCLEAAGSLEGLALAHIEAALELVREGRTGARLALPEGLALERGYDTLTVKVQRERRAESGDAVERHCAGPGLVIPLLIPGRTMWPCGGWTVEAWVDEPRGPEEVREIVAEVAAQGRGSAAIDLDSLKGRLVLRVRRPGDRFHSYRASGERKLKETLIDDKVPRQVRDTLPLLADDDGILWIVGLRTASRGALTPETARVLRLRVIGGDCLTLRDMI